MPVCIRVGGHTDAFVGVLRLEEGIRCPPPLLSASFLRQELSLMEPESSCFSARLVLYKVHSRTLCLVYWVLCKHLVFFCVRIRLKA